MALNVVGSSVWNLPHHPSGPYNFEVVLNLFNVYVPDDESVSVLSVLNIQLKPSRCKSQYSYSFNSTIFYSDAAYIGK
jgi:hypothetical protein